MPYGEAFYSQFKKTIALNECIEDFESVNDQLRYLKTETKEQHVKSGKIKEMQDFYGFRTSINYISEIHSITTNRTM